MAAQQLDPSRRSRAEVYSAGSFGGRQRANTNSASRQLQQQNKRLSFADPIQDGALRGVVNADFHHSGEFVCYKPTVNSAAGGSSSSNGRQQQTVQISEPGESSTDARVSSGQWGYDAGDSRRTKTIAIVLVIVLLLLAVSLAIAVPLALQADSRRAAIYQPAQPFIAATASSRHTTCGIVSASSSSSSSSVYEFRGIPYALPLLGYRQLLPAQPITTQLHCSVAWKLTAQQQQQVFHERRLQQLHANGSSPMCLQQRMSSSDQQPVGQADCLYLDIVTPTASANANLPTVILLSGVIHLFSPESLLKVQHQAAADTGAVFVIPRYRLGAMAFFTHPQLNAESPTASSGNLALTDVAACLSWVRDNVHYFGGSASQVTILGINSGASLALSMAMSGQSSAHYHRLWLASPGVSVHRTLDEAARMDAEISNCVNAGCRQSMNAAAFIQSVPWAQLATVRNDFFDLPVLPAAGSSSTPRRGFLVSDGRTVLGSPLSVAQTHSVNKPIVIGSMAEEAAMYIHDPTAHAWTDSHLQLHIEHRLKGGGANVSGVGAQVMSWYAGEWAGSSPVPVVRRFAQAVTDARVTCPLRQLTQRLKGGVLYKYVMHSLPARPLLPFEWSSSSILAAFGTFDAQLLLGHATAGSELASTALRSAFRQFVHHQPMPQWRSYGEGSWFNVIDANITAVSDYRRAICEGWNALFNGSQFAWYS